MSAALGLTACSREPKTPDGLSESAGIDAAGIDADISDAPEFQLVEKVAAPGCRSTLYHPLKMKGESDAADFSRWTATDLEGNEVTQDVLQNSRITLVNVWATFCGGHTEDLEILQSLYDSYDRADLNIIGIPANVQTREGDINADEVEYIQYLLDLTGAEYLQLLPSDDLIQIKLKDLKTLPESFLLDGSGNVIGDSWTRSRTKEELRQIIDAALTEFPENQETQ